MSDKQTVWEFFQERAAIMEFDGKQERAMAERYALREVMKFYGREWVEVLRKDLTKSA